MPIATKRCRRAHESPPDTGLLLGIVYRLSLWLKNQKMELRGIEPRTSPMLREYYTTKPQPHLLKPWTFKCYLQHLKPSHHGCLDSTVSGIESLVLKL